MSSQYSDAKSSLAVDGNTDSDLKAGSCTHTKTSREAQEWPWWAVDLGDVKYVFKVVIVNRGDCCGKFVPDSISKDPGLEPRHWTKFQSCSETEIGLHMSC